VIGRTISHYKIVEKLGRGGMGIVYKAEDTLLKRIVALKFLPAAYGDDPSARERFLREARAASALDHPNVCAVYEVGTDGDDQLFIAMAFCEGRTLKEKRGDERLAPPEALRIAVQVAEGLAQAHAKGIIHRDVTPGNVIVGPDGTVKIVDFGLAKLVKEATITRSGSTVGTVAYMSPEQTRGEIDYRSDLWALGVVLYEMLAGHRPFRGGDADSIIYSIRHDDPPPLEDQGEVTSDFELFLKKALAKDVSGRYQSASQMAHDLNVLKRNAEPFSSSVSTRILAEVSRRRFTLPRSSRYWLGLFLALLAAAAAVTLVGSDPELALLPLEYEGPASSADLVELLPVVLADQLRASTNLRVTPFASTRHFPVDSDSDAARRELAVDWVLDGMVSVTGSRFNATFQLTGARNPPEGWPLQIEGELANVLDLTADVSTRVALAVGAEDQRRSRDALEHYRAGKALLEGWEVERDAIRAEEAFRKALALDSGFAEAHAGLSGALWKRYLATTDPAQVERAFAAADRAVSLAPTLPEAHLALGVVQLGRGLSADARQSFERAQGLAPADDSITIRIAEAYAELGREQDAERMYQRAIELRPGNWKNYNGKGVFYLGNGHLDKARAMFREVVRLVPASDVGYNNLAAAHIMAGELEEAEPLLREADRLNRDADVQANLGFVYYATGRFQEAADAFRLAAELGGGNVAAHFGSLGDAERQLSNREAAERAYQNAVAIWETQLAVNPTDVQLHAEIATGLAGLGRCDEAREHLSHYANSGEDRPYLDYLLAISFALCQDEVRALEHARRAVAGGYVVDVRTSPDLRRVLDHLSMRELLSR